MKILHVVAGLAQEGGGLSELVPQLAQAEVRLGNDVTLATRAEEEEKLSSSTGEADRSGVRVVRFAPSFPGFVYFSLQMLCGLDALVKASDVVHVHGNWTFPVWFACWRTVRFGRTLIMSPQGSFDPVRLAHSAWKKRLVSWIDRRCLATADLIHVTAERERTWVADWIRADCRRGNIPPMAVVPNGTAFPPEKDASENNRNGTIRTWLYLGRLHPLKGIEMLLQAYQACTSGGRWRLVICGPDEQGTKASLLREVERLGLTEEQVIFRDAVYGEERWSLLRAADCLVLPTRSENFGIVVSEALACKTPVICTRGAPWQELETEHCGYWCEVSVAGIVDAMQKMATLPETEWREMGARGRALVERKYTWECVSRQLLHEVSTHAVTRMP